jgi:hypothetical protein
VFLALLFLQIPFLKQPNAITQQPQIGNKKLLKKKLIKYYPFFKSSSPKQHHPTTSIPCPLSIKPR